MLFISACRIQKNQEHLDSKTIPVAFQQPIHDFSDIAAISYQTSNTQLPISEELQQKHQIKPTHFRKTNKLKKSIFLFIFQCDWNRKNEKKRKQIWRYQLQFAGFGSHQLQIQQTLKVRFQWLHNHQHPSLRQVKYEQLKSQFQRTRLEREKKRI